MFALVFYVNKQVNAAPLDSVLMGNLMSVVLIPLIFFDAQVTFDVMPWMLLLIMGIFQLGFGYIFFALGIEKISATQSNVIATLEPILNPIWVYIFLGEPLTWYALLGGLFVLSSIVFYNFRVGFNHE
jgi:drug/metabolite transporter (DMT)-like permease